MVAGVEIPINRNATAIQMAETIFGDGVQVISASYTGSRNSSGIYTNGDAVSPGLTPGDTGIMLSTGDLRDFTNSSEQANLSSSTSTNTTGPDGLSDFNAAAGAPTFDAAILDVDFIPTGNVMTMQFVFASEEYPEYAVGAFQDFFGVWINGGLVPLSVGDGDIDPNNINAGTNGNLFIDNTNSDFNTEMDGFTLTLTLTIPVNPDVVNSIRIGIADVADSNYDSTVLIAANSVQTALVAMDDMATLFPTGSRIIDVLANDVNATGGTLMITHLNGVPVVAGDIVTLKSGQQIQLNADGTITVVGDGDTELFNFTYGVASSTGATDVGIVTVDSVPCFVAGTRIRTPEGAVAVECLRPGDLVLTKDEGAQPLRWIGTRRVQAIGDFAPIAIAAGTFGRHGALRLSPLHRVLIRDSLAELLFGEAAILAEICALFPAINPETGAGYSPAARRTLRPHEARLLAGRAA